jgi:hypothetical protein
MSRVGINNNDCFDPNKLTEAEHNAIATIIGSLNRRKMILELIINKMCEISDENTAFISGMLPEVIAKYTSQVENRVRTMRHSLEMVGPMMYDMLRRKIDIPDYELLLYIRTTWDWKKMYEDSLNRNDCRMVKTSELVRGIEFADHIVYQFRKLIDRIDLKKPLVHYSVNDCVKDQLPIPIVDMFPDTHEFLSWCKKNRKLWDDLPKNWKPDNLNPQKKAKKK